MKKVLGIVGIFALAAASAVHAFMLRDEVDSLWPNKLVQIDGRASEWSDQPVLQEVGLSFRAMNDSAHLYLLIRGMNDDGRMEISGRYRQNVTLWFLKADETTRAWGMNLNFSHIHRPQASTDTAHVAADGRIISLSSVGVEPEVVIPNGLQVSTATLPSEIDVQADLSTQNNRQPLYEISLPLKMIEHQGPSILMDFVTSEIIPEVTAQLQSGRSDQDSSQEGGGGGRHHGGGGSHGGGHSHYVEVPEPLDLHLEIALAQEPKQ